MSSVVLALTASTVCASAVMLVGVAAVCDWLKRRRWSRELDREFFPDS